CALTDEYPAGFHHFPISIQFDGLHLIFPLHPPAKARFFYAPETNDYLNASISLLTIIFIISDKKRKHYQVSLSFSPVFCSFFIFCACCHFSAFLSSSFIKASFPSQYAPRSLG